MSSHSQARIQSYKAGGAIAVGQAVKFGADRETVVAAAQTTDKAIGIAQSAVSAGDATNGIRVEVALPGGGGKALAQATITAGKLLTSHTDGKLKPVAAANDRVIGMAMEDAVAGDVFAVEVLVGQGTATES